MRNGLIWMETSSGKDMSGGGEVYTISDHATPDWMIMKLTAERSKTVRAF